MRFLFVSIFVSYLSLMSAEPQIVFISGHHSIKTYFAQQTRKNFEAYTSKHGYGFYYEESEPKETQTHALHFRRCKIIQNASIKYPSAQWFVWVDSDVYVNRPELTLESQIDLSDTSILYHLFHEQPWPFAVNTGVKIVNRAALKLEKKVWKLRNTPPWNDFPFEQKTIIEYILPQIPGRYIIHDPYALNCLLKAYPEKAPDALFVHMCAMNTDERNAIMAKRAMDGESNDLLDNGDL